LELSRAELQEILSGPHNRADIQSAGLKAARDALKKFGLQLERRKITIEMLVIDSLEKTPTEN
jgi:uncharacterized protein (TIGR03435 family)